MAPDSVTTLNAYSPPGHLSDLTDGNKQLWSKQNIARWIQCEIDAVDPQHPSKPLSGAYGLPRTPLAQFFNGTVTAFDVDQTPAVIDWTAFPNLVGATYTQSDKATH